MVERDAERLRPRGGVGDVDSQIRLVLLREAVLAPAAVNFVEELARRDAPHEPGRLRGVAEDVFGLGRRHRQIVVATDPDVEQHLRIVLHAALRLKGRLRRGMAPGVDPHGRVGKREVNDVDGEREARGASLTVGQLVSWSVGQLVGLTF